MNIVAYCFYCHKEIRKGPFLVRVETRMTGSGNKQYPTEKDVICCIPPYKVLKINGRYYCNLNCLLDLIKD